MKRIYVLGIVIVCAFAMFSGIVAATGDYLETPEVITSYKINEGETEVFSEEIKQPLFFNFGIDLNSMRLNAEPIRITNDGEVSLDIYANTCKSIGLSTPKVVKMDKFTDWGVLTSKETLSNISFGLNLNLIADTTVNGSVSATLSSSKPDTLFWFADETEQVPVLLYTLAPGETIELNLDGKFGSAWTEMRNLNYKMDLLIKQNANHSVSIVANKYAKEIYSAKLSQLKQLAHEAMQNIVEEVTLPLEEIPVASGSIPQE